MMIRSMSPRVIITDEIGRTGMLRLFGSIECWRLHYASAHASIYEMLLPGLSIPSIGSRIFEELQYWETPWCGNPGKIYTSDFPLSF